MYIAKYILEVLATTTKAPGQKKKANMKKGGHARKKPIKLIEKIVRR